MNQFWNERYASNEYAYGTEPNLFLKEQLQHLKPGKILFPAEGEGRNAVYAAALGWEVYAFDSSSEAAKKAKKLATEKHVSIKYTLGDITDVQFPVNSFNCISLLYVHLPPELRSYFHKKALTWLKPGGNLILEGFSRNQIHRNSGGPRTIQLLFSEEELEDDFSAASWYKITETETRLDEGKYHQGISSLIRVLAVK